MTRNVGLCSSCVNSFARTLQQIYTVNSTVQVILSQCRTSSPGFCRQVSQVLRSSGSVSVGSRTGHVCIRFSSDSLSTMLDDPAVNPESGIRAGGDGMQTSIAQ